MKNNLPELKNVWYPILGGLETPYVERKKNQETLSKNVLGDICIFLGQN